MNDWLFIRKFLFDRFHTHDLIKRCFTISWNSINFFRPSKLEKIATTISLVGVSICVLFIGWEGWVIWMQITSLHFIWDLLAVFLSSNNLFLTQTSNLDREKKTYTFFDFNSRSDFFCKSKWSFLRKNKILSLHKKKIALQYRRNLSSNKSQSSSHRIWDKRS